MNNGTRFLMWCGVGLGLCLGATPMVYASSNSRDSIRDLWMMYTMEQNQCTGQMQTLSSAFQRYGELHDGMLPAADGLAGLLELGAHGIRAEHLLCPGCRTKPVANPETTPVTEKECDYVYFGNGNLQSPLAATIPILFEKPERKAHHLNVLFMDGHIAAINKPGVRRLGSRREVVDYLATQYNYPADVLAQLREKATRLDEAARHE